MVKLKIVQSNVVLYDTPNLTHTEQCKLEVYLVFIFESGCSIMMKSGEAIGINHQNHALGRHNRSLVQGTQQAHPWLGLL